MSRHWPTIAVTTLLWAGLGAAAGGCLNVPPPAVPGSDASGQAEATLNDEPYYAGKPIGELYDVGEVRQFVYVQGGRKLGTSWGRYDGPFERDGETFHRFSTRIELDLPNQEKPARSEGEIVVDERGDLVEGFERSDAVVLKFKVEEGLLRLEAGKEADEIKHSPGDAYMAFMATMHEEIMFGLRALHDGDMTWRISTLSGGLPTQWTGRVIASQDGVVSVRTSLGEVVDLSDGRISQIEVAEDDLLVRPLSKSDAAWPEWSIQGPRELHYQQPPDANWIVREVELPGKQGEPLLAGEVLVPKKASDKDPRPAVLFLAAAGLTDRYGFAGPPPVDLGSHEITDALARAGFVVLRYDEPGHGQSDEAILSWERQLEDARRGLRTLMVQPEVDPSNIVVVGHGEGGWRGLRLAVERPREVAGVALLAAPGRPYRQILKENAEVTIARLDASMRDEARRQHKDLIAAIMSGQGVPPEFAVQALWLREIMDFDPTSFIRQLGRTKLWIAQGGKDFEVDVQGDPLALDRAARRAKKSAELTRYANLDHLFKVETDEVSRPSHYKLDRPVDVAFLGDLVDWIRKTTR